MDDVAAEAGVSRALVSLVMRNAPNVSDTRRSAVLEAASRLDYRPNVNARNLASAHTDTVGVMINDLHNPYFVEVLDGMGEALDERGYRLLLIPGGRAAAEKRAMETLLEYRVDGLVLAGTRAASGDITAAARTTPVVLVGRSIRSPLVDCINNDEATGARLVVEHLIALGHQRIAHIDGGSGAGAIDRRAGYETAMTDAGLSEFIRVVRGDFNEESGADGASELLTADIVPTAVFAANDLSAAGALDRFEEKGLRVPNDVSVVGYDNTGLAAMPQLALSTVHQPREMMGRMAVEALFERIDGVRTEPRRDVLAPRLVARRTSGPAPDQTGHGTVATDGRSGASA